MKRRLTPPARGHRASASARRMGRDFPAFFSNRFFPAEGSGRGWPMTLVALLCLVADPRPMSAQSSGLQHMVLRVGFTRSSFRNVNATDVTAAFRIFAQAVARKRGYQLDTDARLFDNASDCEAEMKKGAINLVWLDTWDYLGMDLQAVMDPVFVNLEQGSVMKDYLLLAHRGSELKSLPELRGKELLLLEGKGSNLARAWLGRLLETAHLDPKETFFRKLETVTKPTAAVLPVFFGAKPACLVDRAAFQIMAELNPQVSSNLVILAASEPYLESVTCLSKSGWSSERARKDVIQAIVDLQTEPDGRQILALFKLDQMVPFKNEYLESARNLRAASAISRPNALTALPSSQTRSGP